MLNRHWSVKAVACSFALACCMAASAIAVGPSGSGDSKDGSARQGKPTDIQASAQSTRRPASDEAAPKVERPANSGPVKSLKQNGDRLAGFTPAREAAALTFVRTHHPELAALLEQLKLNNFSDYQAAIRDLFRTSERLAHAQEHRPERYELELQEWKLSSRIQLLAARLTMGKSQAVEDELRSLLSEHSAVRLELLTIERSRVTGRLAELDAKIEAARSESVDARLEKLLRNTRSAVTNSKQRGVKTVETNRPSKSSNTVEAN